MPFLRVVASATLRASGPVKLAARPAHSHSGLLPAWWPHSPHHRNLTSIANPKRTREELKRSSVTLHNVGTGCHCAINGNVAELFAVDVRFQLRGASTGRLRHSLAN
jgi:hypothetical protein